MKTRRYRSEYKRGKKAGYAEGYAQGLHDGNPFIKIADAAANMAKVISDKMTDPAFIEALKKAKAIENHDREYFHDICPYTNVACGWWDCEHCGIEKRERDWVNKTDEEEAENDK